MKNQKIIRNFFWKIFFDVKKSKFANRLKRALPKFRDDWSEVRGVTGRSKFVAASVGRAERQQCAGVPPPAWLNPAFLEVWGQRPYREGSARPVDEYRPSFKNSSWAPSWLQVRIFSRFVCIRFAFWAHLTPSCYFLRFLTMFLDFRLILGGFGRIWGRFLDDVWYHPGKLRFCKNCGFTMGKP